MAYPRQFPSNWIALPVRIADVSTADTEFVVPGFRGKIKYITSVLKNAITGADAVCKVQIDGVDVTGSGFTVTQSGSAARDVDSATPTAANSFGPDSVIGVVTDGASSTAAPLTVTLWCEPT